MTTIYVLFKAVGDGDSYTRFDALGLFSTEILARAKAKIDQDASPEWPKGDLGAQHLHYFSPVHKDMGVQNRFTIVGSRADCRYDCFNNCGGYVIEKMTVDQACTKI